LKRLDLFKAALHSKTFESMAAARPVVAARWGEAAELVEDAGCGRVVRPEDPQAMRDAVEQLAADPDQAAALGASGRRYVIEHFERGTIAQRFGDLLRQVTAP